MFRRNFGILALATWMIAGVLLRTDAQDATDIPRALVTEANRALKSRKTEIGGSLGVVHELVARLRKAGEDKKAASLLARAVKASPWDMVCQIHHAEVLQALGKTRDARKKAGWILAHAREDDVRARAARLLDEPLPPAIPMLERPSHDKTELVLVPLPPVDSGLVRAVSERMKDRLAIPVQVRSFRFKPLPAASRNTMKKELEEHRIRFEERAGDEEVTRLLRENDLAMDDLLLEHVFVPVYRTWLIQGQHWKHLRLFDSSVTRVFRPQWNANKLVDFLFNRQLGRYRSQQCLYFAITRADIYLSDNVRFNFAASGRHFSLISYSRFLPWCTREDPDWDRLVERTYKQALTSVGRCLGITRCPDPNCVCSYANGLRDHDAKNDHYCSQCLSRIQNALSR